jgi:hypothetical protein
LNDIKREIEFEQAPKMQKLWKALQKKDAKSNGSANNDPEKTFITSLIKDYFTILNTVTEQGIRTLILSRVGSCRVSSLTVFSVLRSRPRCRIIL